MNEIGADDFVIGRFKDSFEIALARLFHGGCDFLVAGFFDRADGQIDARNRRRGDPERRSWPLGGCSMASGSDPRR